MKLSDSFIDKRLHFRIKGFISQLTTQPFDYEISISESGFRIQEFLSQLTDQAFVYDNRDLRAWFRIIYILSQFYLRFVS
jgi:hypothetical protein